MHYNAFLAVLFLRVVLYGPQNLVSLKSSPARIVLVQLKQRPAAMQHNSV